MRGVRLYACQSRLSRQPALAGLKHLNRLEQVLARREWHDPRYFEGLMLDTEHHVIECVSSNLFMAHDGGLFTPGLEQCGVGGVLRRLIIDDLAPALGLEVEVTSLTIKDLMDADEIFLCNSVIGVLPVIEYASGRWPPGPLTRRLQAAVDHVFA